MTRWRIGALALMIASTGLTLAAEAEITIAAVGDIMIGTDYPDNRLPDDDGTEFLAEVQPVLSAADIAIGNLEGVILAGGNAAKSCARSESCFLFRSPPLVTPAACSMRDSTF